MGLPSRPVVRYHGGKWMLAPWVIGFFPRHRLYIEPYGGGGSVLLRKPRSFGECYNDLDGQLVNLFRVLRDPQQADELRRVIELTPFSRVEFFDSYQPSDDPVEFARRTVVRAFMGFGSGSITKRHSTGFRAMSVHSNAMPATDWRTWPDQIPNFVDRLRGVVIENRPALEVIAQQDHPDALFYVDPPYPWSTRSNLRGRKSLGAAHGYKHEMTDDDHRALAATLDDVKGMVVLSGYPCELYDRELFPHWVRHERLHLADGARPRTEVVWLNSACATALAGDRAQASLDL